MSIVVGYADTDEGAAAAKAALREARVLGTRLIVVPMGAAAAKSTSLDGLVERAKTGGVDVQIKDAAREDKTEHLLQVAEEGSAELIVIGLRRRSRVGKLILGSGAQRILLDAPCPVLTVKPGVAIGE